MTDEEKRLRELLTKESVDAYRDLVIEECASVAQFFDTDEMATAYGIAAAIRKLKKL